MSRFWNREGDPVEGVLRDARPEGRDELVARLADRVATSRPARRWSRAAFAGAMTVFMLGSFASFGALGYAASGARDAAKSITRIAAPAKQARPTVRKSSAQDQYGVPKATPVVKVKAAVVKKPKTRVAGAFTPPPVRAGSELPFTGLGLGATAGLGLLLLGLGAVLRRRETARNE